MVALPHVGVGGGLFLAIYDQHDYSDEKADSLQRLATLVDRIINPPTGNVVPLRIALLR